MLVHRLVGRFPFRLVCGSSVSRWLRPTLASSRNDHLETIKRSMTSLQLQSSQRFLLDHRDKSQSIRRLLHSYSGESSTDHHKFATLCGEPKRVEEVVDLTITKDIRPLLAKDKITYITLSMTNEHVSGQSDGYGYSSVDHEDLIEACILPPSTNCAFPSTLDYGKQSGIIAPNVIFRRRMPIDEWRFNHSIECLKLRDECMQVAWIGHQGIGKSTEANFLMMEFLSHLGEEGWPNTILHRVAGIVYEYKRIAKDKQIEYREIELETLSALRMLCKRRRTSKPFPLVIVELEEKESDPDTSGLPAFIALSARDIENTLKTFGKNNTGRFLTVRPHTHKEMRTMCRLFYQFDQSKLLNRFNLPTTASEDDALKVLDDRIEIVGCLPRVVFKDTIEFNSYVKDINADVFPIT